MHLCPPPGKEVKFSRLTRFGLRARARDAGASWMNPPEDNGGLTAHDDTGALAAIGRAMTEPACCRERATDWLDRHVAQRDGATAERMTEVLRRLVRQD